MGKEVMRALHGKKFQNFISLGSNCSVAMELQKLQIKGASCPFDWVISDFKSVVDLIKTHFAGFLQIENMCQNESALEVYKDKHTGIVFFHDFTKDLPIKKQFGGVKKRFTRRIKRFYKNIKSPTLFIRYIRNQEDAYFIQENYNECLDLFKSFNSLNDIIFIKNEDLVIDIPKCLSVVKDKDDVINRHFLDDLPELKFFLSSFPRKRRNVKYFFKKIMKRIIKKRKRKRNQLYIHDKQYR